MRDVALVLLLLIGFAPAPLVAQYGGSPSDTLRYSEITNGSAEMVLPNGVITVRTVHDAVVAVTFPAQGRVVAWYDALLLESSGPMGRAQPSTAALIGQPFDLQFAPTGHVAAVKAPAMPPEIAEMTDLTRQFDDFFITLPPDGLTVGATWADTIVNNQGARESDSTSTRHIRSYVAERDTSVAGVPAIFIRIQQSVEIATSTEMPEENMKVSTKLTGTDEGWALFAPAIGRLIERQRNGSLDGEMLMQQTGMPAVSIAQSYTYRSRISLR